MGRLAGICMASSGEPFAMPRYAELEVTTNFTFLTGGSHPEELVATAKALGLDAIAVTDRNTLAGGFAPISPPRRPASSSSSAPARSERCAKPSRLSDRPRRLRPALPAADARSAPRRERAMHAFLDDVAAHAEGLIFIVLPPERVTLPHLPCSVALLQRRRGPQRSLSRRGEGDGARVVGATSRRRTQL